MPWCLCGTLATKTLYTQCHSWTQCKADLRGHFWREGLQTIHPLKQNLSTGHLLLLTGMWDEMQIWGTDTKGGACLLCTAGHINYTQVELDLVPPTFSRELTLQQCKRRSIIPLTKLWLHSSNVVSALLSCNHPSHALVALDPIFADLDGSTWELLTLQQLMITA